MARPHGGSGGKFDAKHTFSEAYAFVGPRGVSFSSKTGENIFARQGFARAKTTITIVFQGERNIHGRVCDACWGFRNDCNGSWIGQCAEKLDEVISKGTDVLPPKEPQRDPQTTSKPTAPARRLNEMVTADDLARWRRGLLRLLDAMEGQSVAREGPAARINRLSREGRIPREIASCMRLVAEMRNVTEYQGKRLSAAETAAAKNSWLAVEAWARESNIRFEL